MTGGSENGHEQYRVAYGPARSALPDLSDIILAGVLCSAVCVVEAIYEQTIYWDPAIDLSVVGAVGAVCLGAWLLHAKRLVSGKVSEA
jgi:hypothetical protein